MRTVTRLPPRGSAGGVPARWHPYHAPKSTPSSTPSQSCSSPVSPTIPSRGYLHTPVSTAVSASENFRCGLTRRNSVSAATGLQTYYLSHKERLDTKRAQKEKFENALKELAVQRLADIWKETSYVIHSNPASSSRNEEPLCSNILLRGSEAQQVATPMTPTTHTFALPRSTSHPSAVHSSPPRRIPLRAFVHEVLRRSKTMWPALQIALCYLDAAKSKVPNAIAEVKQGQGLQAAEAALDQLFGSAIANDLSCEKSSHISLSPPTPQTLIASPSSSDGDVSDALAQSLHSQDTQLPPSPSVSLAPAVAPVDGEPAGRAKRRRIPPVPVSPLPPRPSPLLCPRRMFVAALILATKFTQDRVYSNRAWAKISGLDAREIGRCERALGEALEWRLWVGKGVVDEPTAFLRNFLLAEENLAKSKVNGIARSKSDGALLMGGNTDSSMTPARSQCALPFGDLSSALKRSSSLASADLFGTPPTSTLMLSDSATLVLTPVNADLDAMDLQPTPLLQHSVCSSAASSFSFDNTPTSSFSSNEYSFTPTGGHGIPTPPFSSQYTPDLHSLDTGTGSYAVSYSKFASRDKIDTNFDPIMGISCGVEGTFDMGIEDIVGNI